MQTNSSIEILINFISNLPTLGQRSARRIVLSMIKNKDNLKKFITLLDNCHKEAIKCSLCNNIDVVDPCNICSNKSRDNSQLCIIEDIGNMFSIEKSMCYNGLYYILETNVDNSILIDDLLAKIYNDNNILFVDII
jgi:recombination protein RecR